jgi:alkylation response protein AidB-like acyl-CoA dehydrogenase
VHALVGDRVHAVEVGAVTWTRIEHPVDPITPLGLVTAIGEGEDVAPASDFQRRGAVLVAAQLAGMAAATADSAVAYAKERRQFDKPIGAFQAVKHICADMEVRAEIARAAVDAAGVTYDDPGVGDVERAIASAKVVATDAALANAKACIQVHGGMGFTWEVDAHLYLKRAWVLDRLFGTADQHAESLVQ